MDVSMAVLEGDEATRRVKAHLPRTPAIALSMHDDPQIAERMHRAGAESYVLKTAPAEGVPVALRIKETP